MRGAVHRIGLPVACFVAIAVVSQAQEKTTSDLVHDAARYLFHPDPKQGSEGFEGMKQYTLEQAGLADSAAIEPADAAVPQASRST